MLTKYCCHDPPRPQINVHATDDGQVDYYTLVLDDRGRKRRLAVKKMPWEKIKENFANPDMREVSYTTTCVRSILPRSR